MTTCNTLAVIVGLSISLAKLHEITPQIFNPLYVDRHRYEHLYGGAGSGKSRFAGQKWLARIIAGYETGRVHRIVALRKTTPAVRKSIYTLFEFYRTAWQLEDIMEPLKSELSWKFSNGSVIICGGLDDPSKLKSIEGVTGFWLEEATEFTRDDLAQVRLRLRGDFEYLQEMLTYNPSDLSGPLYADIYRHLPPRYSGEIDGGRGMVLHSTYKDNPFIDAEYGLELESLKEKDEGYYKIYTLGEWGGRKALIYHGCYQIVDDAEWPAEFEEEFYGLDFGYNNPTALVSVGMIDDIPYADEIIYESKLTNGQLIEKFGACGVSKSLPIYADSAEPARIQEICDAGYNCMPAENAKKPNAVRARIDYIKSRGFRVRASATNMIEELAAYKWKEDSRTGVVLDEPVKFMDHAMNAVEYAIFEHCSQRGTPGVAFA